MMERWLRSDDPDGHAASRQSVGFEVLKKFSTATSTVASFDFQGRLVRRDGYNPVIKGVIEKTSEEIRPLLATKALGTTIPERQDEMLALAKEIYK